MNPWHIALAQVNTTVGALAANAGLLLRAAQAAAARGAQLIAFPELALSGYPPEDLVLKPHFLADTAAELQRFAVALPPEPLVIAGFPEAADGKIFNAAAVLHGGKIIATYRKMLLPNYGVFDEKRLFTPGEKPLVIEVAGLRLGLHICEDSWMLNGTPCRRLRDAGLDLLLNISASPYHHGKLKQREDVLRKMAQSLHAPLAYCNLVGGQDELVFDGASLCLAADGREMARAKQFEDDVLFVTLEPSRGAKPALNPAQVDRVQTSRAVAPKRPRSGAFGERALPQPPRLEPVLDDVAEVYAALKLGLRDYVEKNRFREVVIALSGGIDSALVAALAVDALGTARVHGLTMPSRFSSSETLSDAQLLAQCLGIECRTLPIERLHQTFLEDLAPCWPGRAPDATEENLQARIRGNIVMALSNKFGWLVLTTGNKSEIATGYCTLYGDMAGGFAVIKDVPKMLVFELARWRNRQSAAPVIPPSIIERPPTAELRANQKDSDSLPEYAVLDPILERYVERDWPAEKIIADGYDAALVRRVIKLVDLNEYKRRQGAPGIKITPKAFSRDRRMPITNQYLEYTRV
ncbi:MAG: NAD+ synthase [Verrucomicrobia bacterium]|nr:MAG: NAD+ synthase [Verrucomicrobiota bacterium]